MAQGNTFIVEIKTDPPISQAIANLGAVRDATIANLREATERAALEIQAEIGKVGPSPYTPRITGTLVRSWTERGGALLFGELKAEGRGVGFEARVGSNLIYAPIVEYGYSGPVRAHTRRVESRSTVVQVGTGLRKFRGVMREVPKYQRTAQGIAFVRAYNRTQPARPYAEPAMKRAIPAIRGFISQAVAAGARGQYVSFR